MLKGEISMEKLPVLYAELNGGHLECILYVVLHFTHQQHTVARRLRCQC